MNEECPVTTNDIVNAYEKTKIITNQFISALSESCKLDIETTLQNNTSKEINMAIFCLSICHRENILSKVGISNKDFRKKLQKAIEQSAPLKSDIEYLIKITTKH